MTFLIWDISGRKAGSNDIPWFGLNIDFKYFVLKGVGFYISGKGLKLLGSHRCYCSSQGRSGSKFSPTKQNKKH